MKAILMSIRPEWVGKILNGRKTIEIRKTEPKCELPIDVYIYCTKKGGLMRDVSPVTTYFVSSPVGPVTSNESERLEGKVVAKFTLREVKTIYDRPEGTCDLNPNVPHPNWRHYYQMGLVSDKLLYGGDENGFSEEYGELLRKHSCLSQQQIFDYLNKDKNVIYGAKGYAWFISDLVIFDKPKELWEFGLMRAPQSWQYVVYPYGFSVGKKVKLAPQCAEYHGKEDKVYEVLGEPKCIGGSHCTPICYNGINQYFATEYLTYAEAKE